MSISKRPNKTAKISRGNANGLVGQLSQQSKQQALRPTRISAVQDLQRLALGVQAQTHQIDFGKPSSSGGGPALNSAGDHWSGLLQKAINTSASQVLGGGILGSGLSSVFSAVFHLFGGGTQSQPPPLERFILPQMEQRTIDTAQNTYVTHSALNTASQASNSLSTQVGSNSGGLEQAAVVKAVRNALLTSSSLNDIIGEL